MMHFSPPEEASHPLIHTVIGGVERADSVLSALEFLAQREQADTPVLVHDAARPCVALEDIHALLHSQVAQTALLARPASDTVKRSRDKGGIPCVEQTLDRKQVWLAQTPSEPLLSYCAPVLARPYSKVKLLLTKPVPWKFLVTLRNLLKGGATISK